MSERSRAEEFVQTLQARLDDGLAAAVLYGSAARGEYREGTSDLNLLVLVKRLGVAELRAVAGPTREWVEAGNPPPLMLTEAEWRASADVFPLEYSDIRDAHVLLAGAEPFEGMRIDRGNLRLQLEHELRSKMIQLREGYLVAADSAQQVGGLLVHSLPTFLTIFRGILRLIGKRVPTDGKELVRETASHLGFEPAPVLEVLEAKRNGTALEAPMDGRTATGYLEAVESTVRWMDRYRPAEDIAAEV